MLQRPIVDRLSAVGRIVAGLAVLLMLQSAFAQEAAPRCPEPSLYQPSWDEPALKGAEAAVLMIVLQDGKDTGDRSVLKLPTVPRGKPGNQAGSGASNPPCKDARIVLFPDAAVTWNPDGRQGTWCLKDSEGAVWGKRLEAAVAAPAATDPARKQPIEVGTTYSFEGFLAQAPEIIELFVYGVPLKDLADQVKKTAMAGLEKHLSDALAQEMLSDWRKSLGQSPVFKRYVDLAKPVLVPAYSADQALAFVDARAALIEGIRSHFLREAPGRFRARQELHALWKQAASEALSTALKRVPDMPWVEPVDYLETLLDIERKKFDHEEEGALRKRREKAARAIDALAIASSDSVVIPLFRGHLPTKAAQVVLLTPATGRKVVGKHLTAGTRVVLSAGFPPSHGLAVVEGDELKADSTELGQALGKMVVVIAGGLADSVRTVGAKRQEACRIFECPLGYEDDCRDLKETCPESPAVAVPAAIALSLVAAPESTDDSECCTASIRKTLLEGLDQQAAMLGRSILEKRPTTRVLATGVKPGREHRFFVCSEAMCTQDTKDERIVAEIKQPVRARHRLFSTATEVALGLNPHRAGVPLGGYRLKDVGGSFGPDRYRRLVREETWSDLLTFSQLVVVYPFVYCGKPHLDGLAVALGPTFATGREAAIGSEWAFRAAYEPVVLPGILFTAGFSVRAIKKPRDVEVGTTFAVPRAGTDPNFATNNEWGVLLSIGIALDLSVLADVAGDIVKAGKGEWKP